MGFEGSGLRGFGCRAQGKSHLALRLGSSVRGSRIRIQGLGLWAIGGWTWEVEA